MIRLSRKDLPDRIKKAFDKGQDYQNNHVLSRKPKSAANWSPERGLTGISRNTLMVPNKALGSHRGKVSYLESALWGGTSALHPKNLMTFPKTIRQIVRGVKHVPQTGKAIMKAFPFPRRVIGLVGH